MLRGIYTGDGDEDGLKEKRQKSESNDAGHYVGGCLFCMGLCLYDV
jgi:hypothetical protein